MNPEQQHPELEPPAKCELIDVTALTVADLNGKLREMILAGNAVAAESWAASLKEACIAYRDLVEATDPDD